MRTTEARTATSVVATLLVAAALGVACGHVDHGAGQDAALEVGEPAAGASPSRQAPESYPEEGAAYVEDAVVDRDQMVALPDAVVAGGSFEVVFPGQAARGPGFVIERRVDDGWQWMWVASSDTDVLEPSTPFTAERFRNERGEWEDGPAFDSTRPHRIRFPEGAELGRYRVCTAPDQPALCAEIEVVETLGLGRSADLAVDTTDRIEVRQVLVEGLARPAPAPGDDQRPGDGAEPGGGEEHPTPFGSSAVTTGILRPDDPGFSDLVAEVAEVHLIDTGEVVYDLGNPDLEMVFLDGEQVLARLGYYRDAGSWGEHGVAGRWMDEQWRLLALITELPAHVSGS